MRTLAWRVREMWKDFVGSVTGRERDDVPGLVVGLLAPSGGANAGVASTTGVVEVSRGDSGRVGAGGPFGGSLAVERRDGEDLQLPLIHFVETDDWTLSKMPQVVWFRVLGEWDWRPYRGVAARYYEALYRFNAEAAARSGEGGREDGSADLETKEQARQRLLFDRAVMGNEDAAGLYEGPEATEPIRIDVDEVAPGKVPIRMVGRAPKDFFSMLKAVVGVVLMGRAPEPEEVYANLTQNPAFARACGFTMPREGRRYRQSDVPALRKLEQFDQIMTGAGLWNEIKLDEVRRSVESRHIKPEGTLIHDTTHYKAYSSFEVVEYRDEKGKVQKKSASRVTKSCGCKDKQQCSHPWEYTDEGAGTVVKSSGRMYWAHKASILSLAGQEVVLDAYAVNDAATHDGQTVLASIDRLHETQPWTKDWFDTLLDDGAADDSALKATLREDYGLRLVCSPNPRRRKPITTNLPRGVARITPNGEPVCLADHMFDYRGVRWDTNVFIFGPPLPVDGERPCPTCRLKDNCCPNARDGRHITLPFDKLPFIDPDDPPLAKRFRVMLSRRTSIERVIKTLKCDLGTDGLTKRGNAAFQARLDKTLIAYHILLRDTH